MLCKREREIGRFYTIFDSIQFKKLENAKISETVNAKRLYRIDQSREREREREREMDDEKREMLRERCVKEFGGLDGKEATDDETKVRQLFTSFMNKKTGSTYFSIRIHTHISSINSKLILHIC